MKRIIFSFTVTLLFIYTLSAQEKEKTVIYFDHNKSELTDHSKSQLENIVKKNKNKKIAQIKVTGYTDSDGSDVYNKMLSKNRALTVSKYLYANGIVKNKIEIDFWGEQQPIASNNDDAGKQKNRRVEILIQYDYSIPQSFKIRYRKYLVNPNSDTVIVLNSKGTSLHIPKNCFVDEHGNPIDETVTLKFREFKNSAEMAFSSIPMTYKQGNQEYFFNSSGMFEIMGKVNNQAVKIAPNKSLKIDYALANKNPEISFFKLKKDESNWEKIEDIAPKASVVEIRTEKITIDANNNLVNDNEVVNEGFQIKDDGNRKNGTLLGDGLKKTDAGHTYPRIVKGLNIESFGVYNCDQIYRLSNRISITAKYVDSKGKEIEMPHILSMIDLQYNGAFSFDPRSFICDAKGKNVLVLFTKKGSLYILDNSEFTKMDIQKSGLYTFTMKNMTNEIKSTRDLAKYLGIKM